MIMSMTLAQERLASQKSEAPGDDPEIALVKLLVDVGFQHKRIAALFDCNQGRIAEIATGKKGRGIGYQFSVDAGDGPEWPLDAPQLAARTGAVKVPSEDTLDSRDIIERFRELDERRQAILDNEENYETYDAFLEQFGEREDEDGEEWQALKAAMGAGRSGSGPTG